MNPKLLIACLVAAGLSVGAAQSVAPESVITRQRMQIVTCREDVDTDAFLKEHHLKLKNPKHHWRRFKGFAAPMDDAMVRKLKSDPRVLFVEADGPVGLCAPPNLAPPFGLNRMQIPQFPLAHIRAFP